MGNVISVNATLHLPCRLLSSVSIFLKIAREVPMMIFVEADDINLIVKESFSPQNLLDIV